MPNYLQDSFFQKIFSMEYFDLQWQYKRGININIIVRIVFQIELKTNTCIFIFENSYHKVKLNHYFFDEKVDPEGSLPGRNQIDAKRCRGKGAWGEYPLL